jgi:REP element-mobilizing transposase RayT
MNRGRRGEDIFSGKKDAKIFTALLQEAAELWDVRISAYCLMGNHYHCNRSPAPHLCTIRLAHIGKL